METSYKDAVEMLMDVIQRLSDAYDASTDDDDKDSIFSTMEILQDEVNSVSAAGLSESNSAYQAQTDNFRNSANQLDDFKTKIDQYINNVALAGSIADSMTKVLALLA